jgi:SSS family solute:Na+ symporter
VLVILLIDPQFSIDLQLIGCVIILQTLPAVALGLYTRWFHRWGLVAGWVVGMGLGMWMLYSIPNAATKRAHFGGSAFPLSKWFDPTALGLDARTTVYVGFIAVLANVVVAALVTLLCRAAKVADGVDMTSRDDYFADEGDARVVGPSIDDLGEPDRVPAR